MQLNRFFSEQLEREAAASRKVVERVPEGQNSWKPHERSMELGMLTAIVAQMPGWVELMIERDGLDLNGADESLRTKPMATRAELLAALDGGLKRSLAALKNTNEEHLRKNWKLTMGDNVLTDQPRYVQIGEGAIAHMAHHRGQLSVYLRLNEVKVPAIYGPSADEMH